MIHKILYEHSVAHGLGTGTSTQLVHVGYKIVVDSAGYSGIQVHDAPERMPRSKDRPGMVTKPNLLYDTPRYALGIQTNKEKTGWLPSPDMVRLQAFWEQVLQTAKDAGDAQTAAGVTSMLANFKWVALARQDYLKVRTQSVKSEWIAVAAGGSVIASQPKYSSACQGQARTADDGATSICCVTGHPCTPLKNFPQVKGIPGTGGKVPLTSYKMRAYRYREREGSQNFPVAPEVAMGEVATIEHACQSLGDGRTRASVPIDMASFMLFLSSPEVTPVTDLLNRFVPEEFVKKAWSDLEALRESKAIVSVLSVRGAKGRPSFMGYEQAEVGTVVGNLLAFRDRNGKDDTFHVGRSVFNMGLPDRPVHRATAMSVIKSVLLGQEYPASWLDIVWNRIPGMMASFNGVRELAEVWASEVFKLQRVPSTGDHMKTKQTVMPKIEDYIQDGMPRFCYLGAFIGAFCHVRSQASGYRIKDESAKILKVLADRPQTEMANMYTQLMIHGSKIDSRKKIRAALSWAEELFLKVGDIPQRLSPQQRSEVSIGHGRQAAFYRALSEHRFEMRKEKDLPKKEAVAKALQPS